MSNLPRRVTDRRRLRDRVRDVLQNATTPDLGAMTSNSQDVGAELAALTWGTMEQNANVLNRTLLNGTNRRFLSEFGEQLPDDDRPASPSPNDNLDPHYIPSEDRELQRRQRLLDQRQGRAALLGAQPDMVIIDEIDRTPPIPQSYITIRGSLIALREGDSLHGRSVSNPDGSVTTLLMCGPSPTSIFSGCLVEETRIPNMDRPVDRAHVLDYRSRISPTRPGTMTTTIQNGNTQTESPS